MSVNLYLDELLIYHVNVCVPVQCRQNIALSVAAPAHGRDLEARLSLSLLTTAHLHWAPPHTHRVVRHVSSS